MFCYFYLVFYVVFFIYVKHLRIIVLDRTLYKFWYHIYSSSLHQ